MLTNFSSALRRRFLPFALILSSPLLLAPAAHAAGADYDGNGFSEIPVLSTTAEGCYAWNLFDPFSGKTSIFTTNFGSNKDHLALGNWIYRNVTSAGIVSPPTSASGGRLVWRIRTAVRGGRGTATNPSRRSRFAIREQIKFLGRPGDIILTGGDFDGDRIADAVVITDRGTGQHRWGLRGSFFLAGYNPRLNVNRAYFDFGNIRSQSPFFMNPDGQGDWFAVSQPLGANAQEIRITQPFTKEVREFIVQGLSNSQKLPVPLAQDDGRDLLVFSDLRGGETLLTVANQRGRIVARTSIPLVGEVTVGNYGPGPGEEIAVSAQGTFFVYNPISGRILTMSGPVGDAADSININRIW